MDKLDKNWFSLRNILIILLIMFSLYMLFTMFGIFLNGTVGLKYEVVSKEDIEYVVLCSKVLMVYIIFVIGVLLFSFKRKGTPPC
jgi:hypothetical protein